MGLVCKRTCSKISRQRKAYDQAVKHSFKSCMHHSKLHVGSMLHTSSVYMQSNACIAACGTLSPHNKLAVCVCVQKDNTLSKLAAMEGAVPKQLQPAFKKVMQKLQQVLAWHFCALAMHASCPSSELIHSTYSSSHSSHLAPSAQVCSVLSRSLHEVLFW